MKNDFRKALKIFRYLSVLYTLVFLPYMVYDDYIFIEKYGLQLKFVGIWLAYFLAYFLCFALYFWIPVSILIAILFFRKIIKRGIPNSQDKIVD